jgi:cell division protein FtsI/penicillin-binding protein 2
MNLRIQDEGTSRRALLAQFVAVPLIASPAVNALIQSAAPPDTDYLLLDAAGTPLATRWPGTEVPFPAASLIKPFTALAYGFAHRYTYTEFKCTTGCWLAGGHGRIGVSDAIAQSCNSFFEQAAAGLDPTAAWQPYGLRPPNPPTPWALAGEHGIWQPEPFALLQAYLTLARRRDEPGVAPVVEGLRRAARIGTAGAIGRALGSATAALAKTGTAPCTHSRKATGDGLTVALYPESRPRYALLVRKHGVPGFMAAQTAGRILHRLTHVA